MIQYFLFLTVIFFDLHCGDLAKITNTSLNAIFKLVHDIHGDDFKIIVPQLEEYCTKKDNVFVLNEEKINQFTLFERIHFLLAWQNSNIRKIIINIKEDEFSLINEEFKKAFVELQKNIYTELTELKNRLEQGSPIHEFININKQDPLLLLNLTETETNKKLLQIITAFDAYEKIIKEIDPELYHYLWITYFKNLLESVLDTSTEKEYENDMKHSFIRLLILTNLSYPYIPMFFSRFISFEESHQFKGPEKTRIQRINNIIDAFKDFQTNFIIPLYNQYKDVSVELIGKSVQTKFTEEEIAYLKTDHFQKKRIQEERRQREEEEEKEEEKEEEGRQREEKKIKNLDERKYFHPYRSKEEQEGEQEEEEGRQREEMRKNSESFIRNSILLQTVNIINMGYFMHGEQKNSFFKKSLIPGILLLLNFINMKKNITHNSLFLSSESTVSTITKHGMPFVVSFLANTPSQAFNNKPFQAIALLTMTALNFYHIFQTRKNLK